MAVLKEWHGSAWVPVGTADTSAASSAPVKVLLAGQPGAVHVDGVFAASTDGRTFETISTPVGTAAYNAGLQYDAVEFDGTTWVTAVDVPAPAWTLAKSLDGRTWQQVPDFPLAGGQCVYWSGSRWLVGCDGTDASGSALVTSPDLNTWTIRSVPVPDFSVISSISGNNAGLLIAVGSAGDASGPIILTSADDGATWTKRDPGLVATAGQALCVRWNGTQWLAVGTDGTASFIVTSPDGITWTRQTSPVPAFVASFAEWDGARWWVSGERDSHIWSSPDGVTWTDKGEPLYVGPGRSTTNFGRVAGLAFDGTTLYVGGVTNGDIAFTTDAGTTWEHGHVPNNNEIWAICTRTAPHRYPPRA